ncbi:MAG: hypothetical protein LW807_07685 [Proteobacteria bacterium]|nr:hypothetical protein [Pseudomonadota bacterium]
MEKTPQETLQELDYKIARLEKSIVVKNDELIQDNTLLDKLKEQRKSLMNYLDQIEHDRIQFIRGLEYSGQQTKELQDKLSQKEFELKAADHVLAEKEKEIELLTNKLNNL